MKKFLLRSLAFLAVATVSMIVLDLCLSYQLKQRAYYPFDTWNDIYKGRINADILIMGNSRAWVQFSPVILDSVLHSHSYNIGQNGSAFDRQYARYKLYRKYNPKPRVIIQNIDAQTIIKTNGFDRHQFFPYLYDPDMRKLFSPHDKFTLAERTLPFYRYAHFGLRNLFDEQITSIKGYCGKQRTWQNPSLASHILFENDPYSHARFDQFLAEATSEGIQVILVKAPIHADYTRNFENLDELNAVYQTFADRYHLPILDYQSDSICADTHYFYNYMHLNIQGAEIFSRQLAEDLKTIANLD